MKETIKTYSGRVLGTIETKPGGDKVVTDFYGKILGYYRASSNTTVDFYGRVLYYGDMSAAFLKE